MSAIHPTAVIAKGAELGKDVDVGPYCVIGPNVTVGDGTRLTAHVFLDGHLKIGRNCRVFPFASIGSETQDLKYRGAKSFVEIGDGTVLREYVTVNSPTNEGEVTRVGARCFLMAYSHVGHLCQVGDEVIMANAVAMAGHVVVENQAILGGLVGIHQFVRIGRMCMIGGCTKIVQDSPPFMIVDGNPAKVWGLNSIGLKRRNVPDEARETLKSAYRILYREGLSTSQALDRIRGDLKSCPELDHLVSFIRESKRGIIK